MGKPANATPALVEAQILAALASGMRAKHAAKAFGVHPKTVYRIAHKGDNREVLLRLRSQFRASVTQSVEVITPKLCRWLEQIVTEQTPGTTRDVDALARSLYALEKASASAAGERGRQANKPEVVVRFASWVPEPLPADVIEAGEPNPEALPEATADPP